MITNTSRICLLMAIMLILILLAGCGLDRAPSGVLRGDAILSMRFPIEQGEIEGISMNTERGVSRSFAPINVRTQINRATVPESAWNALAALRQDWCAQPPTFIPDEPQAANFVMTFQCGRNYNPVYYIRPADLPAPLQTLIDLVPSTGHT